MDDNIGYDGWIGSVEYGDWYCLCGEVMRIWGGILWWMYR